MEYKVCRVCGRSLSIDNFYKGQHYKGGYFHACKECYLHLAKKRKEERIKAEEESRSGILKLCGACGKELPIEAFPINRGRKDGHLGICSKCFRAMSNARPQLTPEQKREQRREYFRRYRLAHPLTPEQKTRRAVVDKARYERIKQDEERYARLKEYARTYYHANKRKWDKYRVKYKEVGSSIG